MSYQTLNLATQPINQTEVMEIINTNRLVALDPNRKSMQAARFEVERYVVQPLANLAATKQLRLGDVMVIDLDLSGKKLACFRDDSGTSLAAAALQSAQSLTINPQKSIAA